MKLSIIIPVLDSHEVVRRQLLYLERNGLPDDTELIIVDDGSEPPIENTSNLPVQILRTNDKRPWTWALARNAGAKRAVGERLLMYDLDHIATPTLIDFARTCQDPCVHFERQLAILDENGVLTQDRAVLIEYGMLPKRPLRVESHHNSFVICRELFWELGGYREDRLGRSYPQGEDSILWGRWVKYRDAAGLVEHPTPPTLYAFPMGRWCGDVDYNPKGMFHSLSRKNVRNYWHKQQLREEAKT